MAPFSISCTTCRARLIVRKPSALGMVVACPKCGGMVLIERPPSDGETQFAEPASAPRPSRATPAGTTLSSGELLSEAHADEVSNASRGAARSTPVRLDEVAFDEVNELLGDTGAQPAVKADLRPAAVPSLGTPHPAVARLESFEDASAAADGGVPPPPRAVEEPPLDPGVDWTSGVFSRWRPWLLSAGGGLLGVACALGVIRLLVAQTAGIDSPVETSPLAAVSDSATPLADKTQTVGEESGETDAANESSATKEPATTVESRLPPPTIAADNADQVALPAGATAPAPTTGDVPDSPQARDQFGELAGLNDPRSERPAAAVPDSRNEKEDNELPIEASGPPGISVVNKGTPLAQDTEARLADSIPEIRFQKIPLWRFLDVMSDYTAVPIRLNWEAATHAGVSAQKTVDVSMSDATIGQILTDVLVPLRLSFRVDQAQIEVIKAESLDEKLRVTKYFVGDLAGLEAAAFDGLVQLVEQVVAPGSWRGSGGNGQLLVKDRRLYLKQSEPAHFETILLLEKLRVARGLPPRSSYPRGLFDLRGKRELARDLLARLSTCAPRHRSGWWTFSRPWRRNRQRHFARLAGAGDRRMATPFGSDLQFG